MQLSNATTHVLLQSSAVSSTTAASLTTTSASSPSVSSTIPSKTPTSLSSNASDVKSSPTIANLILQGIAGQSSSVSTGQSGWQACQASLVSWSNSRDQAFPTPTAPIAELPPEKTVYKYGVPLSTVPVYTTIDGIPHAHSWPSSERLTTTITEPAVRISDPPGRPTCTIEKSVCSSLWMSYLSSLGLPTDLGSYTAEPDIFPVPSNRPRCSLGTASISCSTVTPECFLSARIVDVFYWPTMTSAPSTATRSIVNGNLTMYSPSVYLKFRTMQAYTDKQGRSHCNTITPLGADPPTNRHSFDGEDGVDVHAVPEMGILDQAIVSVPPTELSSLIRDLGPDVNTASVINEIAHGGKSYTKWINVVRGTGLNLHNPFVSAVKTVPVDYADFHIPGASAYYLNPRGADYCDRVGPHEACGTIYDGGYRAQLALPTQVRNLRPEWAHCTRAQFGIYDPPIALQAAGDEGVMSVPLSDGNAAAWTVPLSSSQPSTPNPAQAATQAQGVGAVSNAAPTTAPQSRPYAFDPPGSGQGQSQADLKPLGPGQSGVASNSPQQSSIGSGQPGDSPKQSSAGSGQSQKDPSQGSASPSSQTASAEAAATVVSSSNTNAPIAGSHSLHPAVEGAATTGGATATASSVLIPTLPISRPSSTTTTNSSSTGPQQSSSVHSQPFLSIVWTTLLVLSLTTTMFW